MTAVGVRPSSSGRPRRFGFHGKCRVTSPASYHYNVGRPSPVRRTCVEGRVTGPVGRYGFMARRVLASLLLVVAACVLFVQAADTPKKKDDKTLRDESALQQERLLRQYSDFEQA